MPLAIRTNSLSPGIWPGRYCGRSGGANASTPVCRRRERHIRRRVFARRWRSCVGDRRGTQEGGEPGHSVPGDAADHLLVGGRPGRASGRTGLLAGEPQGALAVGIVDVPHPGDGGALALHMGRDIAANAVLRRQFPGHHRDLPRLGFLVELLDEAAEHRFRWAINRFEGHRGAALTDIADSRREPGRRATRESERGDAQKSGSPQRMNNTPCRRIAPVRTPHHRQSLSPRPFDDPVFDAGTVRCPNHLLTKFQAEIQRVASKSVRERLDAGGRLAGFAAARAMPRNDLGWQGLT